MDNKDYFAPLRDLTHAEWAMMTKELNSNFDRWKHSYGYMWTSRYSDRESCDIYRGNDLKIEAKLIDKPIHNDYIMGVRNRHNDTEFHIQIVYHFYYMKDGEEWDDSEYEEVDRPADAINAIRKRMGLRKLFLGCFEHL